MSAAEFCYLPMARDEIAKILRAAGMEDEARIRHAIDLLEWQLARESMAEPDRQATEAMKRAATSVDAAIKALDGIDDSLAIDCTEALAAELPGFENAVVLTQRVSVRELLVRLRMRYAPPKPKKGRRPDWRRPAFDTMAIWWQRHFNHLPPGWIDTTRVTRTDATSGGVRFGRADGAKFDEFLCAVDPTPEHSKHFLRGLADSESEHRRKMKEWLDDLRKSERDLSRAQ